MTVFTQRTRIKICGLTREADVQAAAEAGADALGFMLYPASTRHVSLARVVELVKHLPPLVTPVLVLVNASADDVQRAVQAVPNALLQFHGDESPAQCEAVQRPYWRAIAMTAGVDLLDWCHRFSSAQALLLDAPVEGYGGGGKVFDWSLLTANVGCPIVLSGGLNPANVIDGVLRVRPWAVDVSSGVEASKGVKDATLIRRFCEAVREADARIADAAT